MKKNIIVNLVLGFGLLFASESFASGFGVVDMNKITMQSKVMKSLNGQKDEKLKSIQTVVDAKRKDFEKREADLKSKAKDFEKREAALKTKASMLSDDAKKEFMGEVATFQKDVAEYEKLYNQFQRDVVEYDKSTALKVNAVEKAYMDAVLKVQKDYLDGIIKKIGKNKGLDLVFNSQATIVVNNDMDITDVVIDELNNQVVEIELKTK